MGTKMLLEAIKEIEEQDRIRTSGGLDLNLENTRKVAIRKLQDALQNLESGTPQDLKNAHYILYGGGAAGESSPMENMLKQIINASEKIEGM
jgi:hypothetical protein